MSTQSAFLGTGWSFPPAFGDNGVSVEMVHAATDIQQSLEILLTTQIGERIMQPDYGCALHSFLFENITQSLINNIRDVISDAILFHEPRINVEEITALDNESNDSTLLLINIDYVIRKTNSRQNFVYPFYLNEAR